MRAADDLAGWRLHPLAALAVFAGRPAGRRRLRRLHPRRGGRLWSGARLLAEARTLPMDTLVVSLESSRTLPGAVIGGGPVIRVGDAGSTFNSDAETALIRARRGPSRQANPDFRSPTATDERRRLRGQRIQRMGLPLHRLGVSRSATTTTAPRTVRLLPNTSTATTTSTARR